MTDQVRAETAASGAVTGKELVKDPDNLPVRHVAAAVSILQGQTVAMTFVTDRVAVEVDGTQKADFIIAARLRFDLKTAENIRDQLNAHISGLSSGPGPLSGAKPN